VARPFRPEVLVLGLSLIALGVVWMLGNAGAVDTLATLHAWWPMTLVVWGALELVAYAVDRRAGRS
jgi:cell wall-active antibiotic response 4TMS protein YvqF